MTVIKEEFNCEIDGDKFTIGTSTREIQFKLDWNTAMMILDQIVPLLTPPFIQKEGMHEEIDGQIFMMEFTMNSNDLWVMDMRYGSDQLYKELTRLELGNIAHLMQGYFKS